MKNFKLLLKNFYNNYLNKKDNKEQKMKTLEIQFRRALDMHDSNTGINILARFMTLKAFDKAKKAYTKILAEDERLKGLCFSQIGSAEFSLGNYKEAIENYLFSIKNGMDKELLEDKIWKAYKHWYINDKDVDHLKTYLGLYPKGIYQKEVFSMLNNT